MVLLPSSVQLVQPSLTFSNTHKVGNTKLKYIFYCPSHIRRLCKIYQASNIDVLNSFLLTNSLELPNKNARYSGKLMLLIHCHRNYNRYRKNRASFLLEKIVFCLFTIIVYACLLVTNKNQHDTLFSVEVGGRVSYTVKTRSSYSD